MLWVKIDYAMSWFLTRKSIEHHIHSIDLGHRIIIEIIRSLLVSKGMLFEFRLMYAVELLLNHKYTSIRIRRSKMKPINIAFVSSITHFSQTIRNSFCIVCVSWRFPVFLFGFSYLNGSVEPTDNNKYDWLVFRIIIFFCLSADFDTMWTCVAVAMLLVIWIFFWSCCSWQTLNNIFSHPDTLLKISRLRNVMAYFIYSESSKSSR